MHLIAGAVAGRAVGRFSAVSAPADSAHAAPRSISPSPSASATEDSQADSSSAAVSTSAFRPPTPAGSGSSNFVGVEGESGPLAVTPVRYAVRPRIATGTQG